MPKTTIPLASVFNQRGANAVGALFTGAQDVQLTNCFITTIEDSVKRALEAYVEKRTGMVTRTTPSAGNAGTYLFVSPSTGAIVSVFLVSGTTYTVFNGTTNCGNTGTNPIISIIEVMQNGTTYYLISAPESDGTDAGWYLASDAHSVTAYTADGNNSTTITDIKIAGVNNTAGLYPGQLLTAGANIVAGTRVVSVDAGAFTAVLDTATTGGAFNDLAITKTPLAKITDADFTSLAMVGGFGELNGYVFFMTQNGRVYNFDLNSFSLTATNYLTADSISDGAIGLVRHNEYIIAFGNESGEIYRNTGNPFGSPLSRFGTFYVGMGVQSSNQKIAQIANQLFWLGSVGPGFGVGLMTLNGLSPVQVSADVIDRLPDTLTALRTVTHSGRNFVSATNLMLNLKNNTWTRFLHPSGTSIVAAFANNAPLCVFNDDSGKVFDWSYGTQASAVYVDNAVAYTMTIQTGKQFLNKGRPFVITNSYLIADKQASGTTGFLTSDDDYANFVTQESFDMTLDQMMSGPCGYFRSHAIFKLTHSANTAWRGEALVIEWEPA